MARTEHNQGGQTVRFLLNNREVVACEGQTVAAALLATGESVLRRTPRRGEPRGLFCGMGVCFDCLMTINGRPNQQACLTDVAEGMRVDVQLGKGNWDGDQ